MLTNSQGFKRFFELYFEPVYRFVRKYTEEDAIARDITQDTFIRLYERRRDFDAWKKQNLLSISQPESLSGSS
ncbi:MAG: RNA polymerase sigma factor [Odoribacter splanchnicus]